jgi:predicted amino acid-binding ACT domain protein
MTPASQPVATTMRAPAPMTTPVTARPSIAPARRSCFQVTGDDHPGLLIRMIELFAQRGLSPAVVNATSIGGALRCEIMVDGLPPHDADVIAAKMAIAVGVSSCHLSHFARV